MKIRFWDRVFACIAGLLLLLTGLAVLNEAFWGDGLAAAASWVQGQPLYAGIGAGIVMLIAVYCLCFTVRSKRKAGFVMQRTEAGEMSISVKAIEGLVLRCVDRQEDLHVLHTALECRRDGLIIKLKISLAAGVSIPLVVGALQKQVRQYVTACSGVDVKEVKVQVEQEEIKGKRSRYAVPETLQRPLPVGETVPAPQPLPVQPVMTPPAMQETDERLPHQRIFADETPETEPAPAAEETAPAPADETPLPCEETEAQTEPDAAEEAAVTDEADAPLEEEKNEDAE